jgi:hypothetical protein
LLVLAAPTETVARVYGRTPPFLGLILDVQFRFGIKMIPTISIIDGEQILTLDVLSVKHSVSTVVI